MSSARALLGWVPHAFSLELRKTFSYRVSFWVSLIGTLVAEIGLAYFLWRAMFDSQGVTEMGGYSFRGMMLYYVMVPLVARLVRGEDNRFISEDIYEGGLTRYLVYPLSFLQYKYVSQLALSFIAALQLLLALCVFAALFGIPPEIQLTPGSLLQGFAISWIGTLLFFFMGGCFEMVAFWQDNVWSLMAMLRIVANLLGGALIPLSLFPSSMRAVLAYLPFEYLTSFPIRCFMGQVGAAEWLHGAAISLAWVLVFGFLARIVWRRGTRQYSGVGL
jgi:ABC-2 type transport system permease protein